MVGAIESYMDHLLPRKPPVESTDPEPNVVRLEDDEGETVMSVLTSEVARSMLIELYQEPAIQSELAERVGTSIQNVNYHIRNLLEAGLVEIVGQWYSEKGTEMDVYGPANEPFVLIVGAGKESEDVRHEVDGIQGRDSLAHSD